LTRGQAQAKQDLFWRAWLARLTALVFVLQSVGLFMAPARVAPAAAEAGQLAMAWTVDCAHHHSQGEAPDHARSHACPMCQTLGCALAGAALPAQVGSAGARLIGLLAIPAPRLPPPAPPLQTPPARGPPVLA
jgi:hypothetical protein